MTSVTLSPTEECIVHCYRKISKVTQQLYFYLWTNAIILINQIRMYIFPNTATATPTQLPLFIEQGGTPVYLVGNVAKEHVLASFKVYPDGKEEDLDDVYIYEHTDTPVTAGDILTKLDIKRDEGVCLSLLLASGLTSTYSWDEEIVYSRP